MTELKTLKICENCGKEFVKSPKLSWNQFESRQFCSNKCKQHLHSEFQKERVREKNSNWKGNNAKSITTFHKRIENLKGKPKRCSVCETTDKNKTYDWANLTGKYEDLEDYKRMCRSCHKKYDLARLGKGLITLKEIPLSKRDKIIISSIAIKWVKKLRFDEEEGVWNIFMDFHNINEEDLK